MNEKRIPVQSILENNAVDKISVWAEKNPIISDLVEFLSLEFKIDITSLFNPTHLSLLDILCISKFD